jgi:drug/metabolite transporter superfamily protein YnfA
LTKIERSRSRVPAIKDVMVPFAVGQVFIHSWAILQFLHELPALLLRMNGTRLLAVAAYVQVAALAETLVIVLLVIICAVALPKSALRDNLAARGGLVVSTTVTWMIMVNTNSIAVREWSLGTFALVTVLYLLSVAIPLALLKRMESLILKTSALFEGLLPLAALYLVMDALSLAIVLGRNFIGKLR